MIFESQNFSLVLRDQIVVLQMLILAQAVQKLVENGYKIDTKCSQTLQNRDDFVNQIFAQKIKANLDISSHILMDKNITFQVIF